MVRLLFKRGVWNFLLLTAILTIISITLKVDAVTDSGTAYACINHPPDIQPIANQTAYVNTQFDLTVNATDQDSGQNLTYEDNTTLFDINSATGEISFTPASTGDHTILINVSDDLNCINSESNTTFFLQISAAVNVTLENLTISQKYDNQTPVLEWSAAASADNYSIYYSSNLDSITSYTVGGDMTNITEVSGITDTEYNDTSHTQDQTHYYRVSAIGSGSESLSENTVGKYTFYLFGLNTGTNDNKRKNWVTNTFNETVDAETFVAYVPNDYGIRVAKLIRDDADSYSYFGHEKGGGNNFTMYAGVGYQIEVSNDINYTRVGTAATTQSTYELFGRFTGTNDNYRKNWVSIGYASIVYDAETYIANVPNDYGIRVAKLIREDSNTYSYFTHEKGGGNNFTMYRGVGYQAELSNSTNYTLT